MKPFYFIFALHNHQPVGNFDGVFQHAYEKAYLPFLDLFEKTTKIKICLHTSGPLLDWLEDHQPEYLQRLAKLAKKGRIEMMSGGFYEPLLPVIREEDAVGQLEMMNSYIRRKFKQEPKGFWLTERVWEPAIPTISQKAGLCYTAVDDTHFFYTGISTEKTFGHFVTENQGNRLCVFPIDKTLRYGIPFRPVADTLAYFENLRKKGINLVTLADDGEKFGLWPSTFHSVYEENWLKEFFNMLEESSGWLKTITFSEAIKLFPPEGRAYLPTASYEEMLEWALPAEQTIALQNFQRDLKEKNIYENGRNFVRGGYFRNFFAKYSESLRMQAKQLYVSRKLSEAAPFKDLEAARRELYRGECNCTYWHGVFGGLYLHHLRRAVYDHLIQAETLIDHRQSPKFKTREKVCDFNLDGRDEIIVETRDESLVCAPHLGGAIMEWDDIKGRINLLDTMTRRFESYHLDIQKSGITNGAQTSNIHESRRQVTKEIYDNLIFDDHERYSALDRVFLSGSLNGFKAEKMEFLAPLEKSVYTWERERGGLLFSTSFSTPSAILRLSRWMKPAGRGMDIKMTVELLEGKMEPFYLGSEWNLNLKTSDQSTESVKEWAVVDEWSPLEFKIESRNPFSVFQFTILTVSQSESVYQLNPQGTCVMPFWKVAFKRSKTISWNWKIGVKEK